jgi:opacity protein-like surface antigen
VGYALSEQTTLEVKYRYFATDDAEFEDGDYLEFESHNIYLGVRYTF